MHQHPIEAAKMGRTSALISQVTKLRHREVTDLNKFEPKSFDSGTCVLSPMGLNRLGWGGEGWRSPRGTTASEELPTSPCQAASTWVPWSCRLGPRDMWQLGTGQAQHQLCLARA